MTLSRRMIFAKAMMNGALEAGSQKDIGHVPMSQLVCVLRSSQNS